MLHHLALAGEWAAAKLDGAYRRSTIGRSLDDEGFIHCSYDHQVAETASRFYAGRDDVVVLVIDPARLQVPVRVEGGFPHIYCELPAEAVVAVVPLEQFENGPRDGEDPALTWRRGSPCPSDPATP